MKPVSRRRAAAGEHLQDGAFRPGVSCKAFRSAASSWLLKVIGIQGHAHDRAKRRFPGLARRGHQSGQVSTDHCLEPVLPGGEASRPSARAVALTQSNPWSAAGGRSTAKQLLRIDRGHLGQSERIDAIGLCVLLQILAQRRHLTRLDAHDFDVGKLRAQIETGGRSHANPVGSMTTVGASCVGSSVRIRCSSSASLPMKSRRRSAAPPARLRRGWCSHECH